MYIQFRTSDGDWVCGIQQKEVETDEMVVENARSIEIIEMDNPGQYGIMFLPYNPTAPDLDTIFYTRHIISKMVTEDTVLSAEYHQHIANMEAVISKVDTQKASVLSIVPKEEGAPDDA